MEVAEQQAGVPDGWAIVPPATPQEPPTSTARPSVTARAGVPAAGRGSQINPDQSMRGLELATTPLAHPTGIDAIDGMTSPVGLASLAAGGVGIARAGLAGGASAGARAVVSQAAPQIKYEITKSALEKVGVPSPLAMAAAMMVSGYKKGAKPTAAVSEIAPEGVETAQAALARKMATASPASPAVPVEPAASGPAAPAPQAAPASPPSAPLSPAASAPSPPAPIQEGPPAAVNTLPDQKSLNEAALAVRRQAYQQRMAAQTSAQMSQMTAEGAAAASAAPVAEAGGYVKPAPLTKAETVTFWDYIKRGMSGADAMKNVQLQRELAATLGTPTPTPAQTRFPKGMRGKSD